MIGVLDRTDEGVLLVSVLVFVALGAATGTAAAQSAPDCSTVTYDGEGTEANPYEVGNVNQLQCMGNASTSTSPDDDFTQVNDIDASNTSSWNSGKGFTPIGGSNYNGDTEFNGVFDGQGYIITDLEIDRVGDSVGLFGLIGSAGTVTKVSVANADIEGSSVVGGIVGLNRGGTVRGSYASGLINGDAEGIGGLVGFNQGGTVSTSYASGSVSGSRSVGGLVGANSGMITESYASGPVSGSRNIGGLVGSNSGTITDSYWDTQATGQSPSAGGTGLTTSEMTGTDARDNMRGFDFTNTWETVSGDYPTLAWQTEGSRSSVKEGSDSNGNGGGKDASDGESDGNSNNDGGNASANSTESETEGLPGFTVVTAVLALLTLAAAAVRRRTE